LQRGSLGRLQYLESLDSVRSTPPSPSGTPPTGESGDATADLAELQVFLEVLLVLALGRDIVVPQSYAFDSWAFVSVANRVLKARDRADTNDRPFHIHVFGEGVTSYPDAVRSMLGRVQDADAPFVSSLLPSLGDLEPGELRAMAQNPKRLWPHADAAHRDLGRMMRRVYKEFRDVAPVTAHRRSDGGQLSAALAAIADPGSELSHYADTLDAAAQDVHRTLATAVQRLDPTRPEAFARRSSLRQEAPWPNDSRGRTAAEVVGGQKTLDLVVEFVDTMYNRVIVGSIGAVPASFVTAVGRSEGHQAARAVAQHLALPAGTDVPDGKRRAEPAFEVRVSPDLLRHDPKVLKQSRRVMDDASIALHRLMALRGEPALQGKPSPFWASVGKLEAAARRQEPGEMEGLLEKHLRLVARTLDGKARVEISRRGVIRMSVGAVLGAAPDLFAASVGLPMMRDAGLTMLAAVAGDLWNANAFSLPGDKTHRLASALGEFVHAPGSSA